MDFISGWMDSDNTDYRKEAPGNSRGDLFSYMATNTIVCYVILYALKRVCDLCNDMPAKGEHPTRLSHVADYVSQVLCLPIVHEQQQDVYKKSIVHEPNISTFQPESVPVTSTVSENQYNANKEPDYKEDHVISDGYESSKRESCEIDRDNGCANRQCNCAVVSMHMRTLDNVTYSGHSDEDLIQFIHKIDSHFRMCPTNNEAYKVHFLYSHLKDQARMLAKFQMEKHDNNSITWNTIVEHLKNTFLCEQMKEIMRIELSERI